MATPKSDPVATAKTIGSSAEFTTPVAKPVTEAQLKAYCAEIMKPAKLGGK